MRNIFLLFPLLFLYAPNHPENELGINALPDTTGGRYAEVVIARKNWGSIVKGDVLRIYSPVDNARRLLANHTNKDSVSRNASGYVKKNTVAYAIGLKMREFRVERISTNSIRRINQFTSMVDTINNTANAAGERMDVPVYIKRKLRREKHMLFGQPGAEVWFGGRTQVDRASVLALIDTVAAHRNVSVSVLRRRAQQRIVDWPIHRKKKIVILRCFDMSDSLKNALSAKDSLGIYTFTIPLANVATETGFTEQQIINAIQNDSDLRDKGVINVENVVELK